VCAFAYTDDEEIAMKSWLIAGVAAASLTALPALALAQATTTTETTVVKKGHGGTAGGAAAGAVTGAAVAGPVGAVVGGAVGAVVGHTADPPKEVRTYVTTQTVPAVTYGQPIVVGHVIDDNAITWLDVPNYPKYRWAYLDGHRVLIDADTHAVVAVY
jgi:uncharacterized membrane protein